MQNFWHQMKIAWHTHSVFCEMWQHHRSAQQIYCSHCYILKLTLETKWKKVSNSVNFSCSLRSCVTPVSSFLSYSISDFHRSPSANYDITINDMDGDSSNSLKILNYSSLVVVILFHWKLLFLRVFCWRMYLISDAQGIVACQGLAWLSSMFKISSYAAMVTCDLFIARVDSVSGTSGQIFNSIAT